MPTYKRVEKLFLSLEKIFACVPTPSEVIVHIDNNDIETETELKREAHKFPNLILLVSGEHLGPGASRNKLLGRATNSIVASFDDDSYPLDSDYFDRIQQLFDQFPKAAMLAASVYHQGEEVTSDSFGTQWVADFTGCGCAYRLEVFKRTTGYLRRTVPYGAEETDLALRLHSMGFGILKSSRLRIFHNTRLEHHESPRVTAGIIENYALIPFLRYPVFCTWLGVAQFARQVLWRLRHGRSKGIATGLLNIPTLLWQHRAQRDVIPTKHLTSYLRLRHQPVIEPATPKIRL